MLKSKAILGTVLIFFLSSASALAESQPLKAQLSLSFPAKGLVLKSVLPNQNAIIAKSSESNEFFICEIDRSEEPCSQKFPLNPLDPVLRHAQSENTEESHEVALTLGDVQVVLSSNGENSTSLLSVYSKNNHELVFSYNFSGEFNQLYHESSSDYLLVAGCQGGLHVFDARNWSLVLTAVIGKGCVEEIFQLSADKIFLRYTLELGDGAEALSTFALFNVRTKEIHTFTFEHLEEFPGLVEVINLNQEWHVGLRSSQSIGVFELRKNSKVQTRITPSAGSKILSALFIAEKHSILLSTESSLELWSLENFPSHVEGSRKLSDLSDNFKILLALVTCAVVAMIIYFAIEHRRDKKPGSGVHIPMLTNGEYV